MVINRLSHVLINQNKVLKEFKRKRFLEAAQMKWEFWELSNIIQTFYFQENLQPSGSQAQETNSVSQDIAFYQFKFFLEDR